MISILLPSRGRPNELLVALKSLDLPKYDKEALIWLDKDDPKLGRYQEVLKNDPNVRVFIRERVGYINGHLMLNFLAEQAKYDWYFFFNDDAYMDNPDWSDILKDFVQQFDPTVEPVAINIWGQGNKANLFPIVSRKYVDVCGHFSMGTANDDWVRIISMRAGIDHQLYGIKPKHRKYGQDETKGDLQDDTYQDAEAARAKHGHEWNPRRGPGRHILDDDVRRIVEYNINRDPRLSVLVPSRGRAETLKYSIDSLGLEANNLEALVWLDEDDPQLEKYQKLFAGDERVKLFVEPRVSYVNFHIMLYFLATNASSDWLFLWNDDACMDDPKWFEVFYEHASLMEPKKEPIVFNIWGQGDTRNQFPIISRKYFNILGYFAPTPICDLYVMRIATYSKIHRTIFGIQPKHRDFGLGQAVDNFEDDTTKDIIELKKRKGRNLGLLTKSMSDRRNEDTKKIIQYLNENNIWHAGFIGLGKLGMPVALAMEARGNRIVGHDINPKVKDYLEKKEFPFEEEGLQDLLSGTLLEVEDSIDDVVKKTDLIFCAVQTPHDPRFEGHQPLPGERADFDYTYLKDAVRQVAAAAEELDKKINLVVISTCLPGTYEKEIKPLLTPNINYVYNPFFIAMGTVINDFYNPEFVLIGKDDGDITPLLNFYKLTLGNQKIFVTDITTAEGIKVFYNTFITAKTVLGNMYGE
ncbi:MAG TPA: NAD(P)-binding domain-containing protein, partial [Candidatus Saccharimonadales bacterium]|nr:NAD(P)-binding domain-containing protein [Candidatus Saccharimonadales bacterium]